MNIQRPSRLGEYLGIITEECPDGVKAGCKLGENGGEIDFGLWLIEELVVFIDEAASDFLHEDLIIRPCVDGLACGIDDEDIVPLGIREGEDVGTFVTVTDGEREIEGRLGLQLDERGGRLAEIEQGGEVLDVYLHGSLHPFGISGEDAESFPMGIDELIRHLLGGGINVRSQHLARDICQYQ